MLLTEYETTVVVRPNIGGDAIEATLDRVREAVTGRGGKLLGIEHWGKKKLAFPIKKHSRGIYVHTHYLGQNDTVAEVERNLRIADSVLRFLTIKLATLVDPSGHEEKEYVMPEYDAEEAAEAAAAVEATAAVEAAEATKPAAEGEAAAKPAKAAAEGETLAKPAAAAAEGEASAKPVAAAAEGKASAKPVAAAAEGKASAKPADEAGAEAKDETKSETTDEPSKADAGQE